MNIVERFLKYVSYDTQSDELSETTPSSLKQLELSKELVKDLKEIGLANAFLDEYGIVYASLKANVNYKADKIGLIAHVDTSPDSSGKDIKARIIKNYDGKDIVLNKDKNIVMSVKEFPFLKDNVNEDLIVTDGTTLLGADDKAGVVAIIEAVKYLIDNPNIKHGDINIAFTPDEEVGRGPDNFNLKLFDSDYGYTLDGGDIHYVEYECFNAASALVHFEGKSIHPGSAKDKMVNAALVAMEFDSLLPKDELPSKTEKYEGFHHLTRIEGQCEEANAYYILRNHDKDILNRQKEDFYKAKDIINDKYGYNLVDVTIKDSYANMKEVIMKHPYVLERIDKAYKALNINYAYEPIRGGTDGARLSFEGLPCPNLGCGGYNFHGPFEYLSITQLQKSVEILLGILKIN